MANALLVRVRYRIDRQQLVLLNAVEQYQDLRRATEDLGDHGELSPDNFFPPVGTDVIILGDAVARHGPAVATRVDVSVGSYHVVLDVFGDRVWETPTRATPAKPFERMPVTYRNAFGGAAKGPYGDLNWCHNPLGKGYFLSQEEAIGKALPNIESPSRHVKNWEDRPEPVGLGPYPKSWGLRVMKLVHTDLAGQNVAIRPDEGMFSQAHPALSGRQVEAGVVEIVGMNSAGSVRFDLPVCPFEVLITLGEFEYIRDLNLQEILIDLRQADRDSTVVDLLYRKMFVYNFVPMISRRTIVRRKGSVS